MCVKKFFLHTAAVAEMLYYRENERERETENYSEGSWWIRVMKIKKHFGSNRTCNEKERMDRLSFPSDRSSVT